MLTPCAGSGSLTRFALVRPLPVSGAGGGFGAGGSRVSLGADGGEDRRAPAALCDARKITVIYCYFGAGLIRLS
jgi:hypothetical protein